MDREEILKRSRTENKGEDLHDKELFKEGGAVGVFYVWIFACVFAVIAVFIGQFPYDVFALAGAVSATVYTVKAVRQKHWQDILAASVEWVYTIVFFIMHVCQQIGFL